MNGIFGPPMKVERTDKHWPPNISYRRLLDLWLENPNLKYMQKSLRPIFEAEELIKQQKFYGAEWVEDIIDSNI